MGREPHLCPQVLPQRPAHPSGQHAPPPPCLQGKGVRGCGELPPLRLGTLASKQASLRRPSGGTTGSGCWSRTLRAVSLLPRGWGLACPAVGGIGHDPAAPLAGTWLSRRLAFAVPWLSPFNFHLDKRSSGLGRCRGSWTPFPSDTPSDNLRLHLASYDLKLNT